jgi:hypothetical protein
MVTTTALVFSALFFIHSLAPAASGQTKRKTPSKAAPVKTDKTRSKPETPGDELERLRKEFIEANKEYQELLKKQLVGLERNVVNAEEKLAQSQKLFAEGLISKRELEVGERAVAQAKDEVAEVNRRLGSAETQIADTLLEAETEAKLRRSKPLPRGGMLSTAALIRYNGASGWGLSDSWKVQRFFMDAFKKPLPIAVFGQGAIHDRWRLDHRNSMDVSLHPDGPEGQALLNFLRANGIPFLAFRSAIPGTATGPHIHVGRPSHRY